MITNAARFVPAEPVRLVPAHPGQRREGSGALYRAGELVEQQTHRVLALPQSTGRSR
jgi:hypothetical protein